MNEETYLDLLSRVSPLIKKEDTVMRAAITPHERLTATLRYLATCRSLEDLKYSTIVSPQALGNIIEETCKAILKVLKNDFCKGPYDLEIKSFEQCDDPGNGEISISLKMRKISKYNYSYDVNWTTHKTFSDDRGIKMRFDVSKWGIGGWGFNAYVYETYQPCKEGRTFAPDVVDSFFNSSGVDPPRCPIKQGTYYLRNWTIELDPSSYFPELPYGKYKGECIFLLNKERLGCWRLNAEITEKTVYGNNGLFLG
ncbi:uncharacterized protein [Anabrus simplex]|uniref:uncharacterized protein n=1 Tax=Anabrus simplex TaxID=316456 RepID=UPI0035A2E965